VVTMVLTKTQQNLGTVAALLGLVRACTVSFNQKSPSCCVAGARGGLDGHVSDLHSNILRWSSFNHRI
jgi:hypothetical protein